MIQRMMSNLQALSASALNSQAKDGIVAAMPAYRLLFEAARHYYQQGFRDEISGIFGQAVAAQPSAPDVLHMFALGQQHSGKADIALAAVDTAIALAGGNPHLHASRGKILAQAGEIEAARQAFFRAAELDGRSCEAADGLFLCEAESCMPGEDYYALLARFHGWLRPAAYVEIGLGHGRSLGLAAPATVALGIDPVMASYERLLYSAAGNPAQLYLETSDEFFARHDLRREMGKAAFDLGFIDGLHLFEQVLKDFINLERYAGKDSVVLIHDCLPINALVAARERCTGFWTGDVWKIVPCLKTMRPDLHIFTIPAKPSGLAVVTNLDPGSSTLGRDFDRIAAYFGSLSLPGGAREKNMLLNVAENDWQGITARLSRRAR